MLTLVWRIEMKNLKTANHKGTETQRKNLRKSFVLLLPFSVSPCLCVERSLSIIPVIRAC
jgi:hypothetical protein